MKNFSHPASTQNPYEKFFTPCFYLKSHRKIFLTPKYLIEKFFLPKCLKSKHFELQGKKKNF